MYLNCQFSNDHIGVDDSTYLQEHFPGIITLSHDYCLS